MSTSPRRREAVILDPHPVIRFKIGDAFPASDPIARFITALAMMSNELLRALEDMLKLEGDTPEEIGRRVSLFRRQAASIHEAATSRADARRMFLRCLTSSMGSTARHGMVANG